MICIQNFTYFLGGLAGDFQYVLQKPEYVPQKPEYVVQKPEYVVQKLEYVLQTPEYVLQKPEYVLEKPEMCFRIQNMFTRSGFGSECVGRVSCLEYVFVVPALPLLLGCPSMGCECDFNATFMRRSCDGNATLMRR